MAQSRVQLELFCSEQGSFAQSRALVRHLQQRQLALHGLLHPTPYAIPPKPQTRNGTCSSASSPCTLGLLLSLSIWLQKA